MTTWIELKNLIIAEYRQRGLKSDVRVQSLDKIEAYLKKELKTSIENTKIILTTYPDKQKFKDKYTSYKEAKINGAENSAINEIYNQLQALAKANPPTKS